MSMNAGKLAMRMGEKKDFTKMGPSYPRSDGNTIKRKKALREWKAHICVHPV